MSINMLIPAQTRLMPVDFYRQVHCVLGLPIDAISMGAARRTIFEAASRRQRCFLSTPNLNFAVACLEDEAFRNSVIDSDLATPDGMPLVWIARLFGVPIHERVTGSGLFEQLQEQPGRTLSIYLFGGPENAAALAAERINALSCGLQCVGSRSPGFGSLEEISTEEIIGDINASGADFLVVALGAKKGQAWLERNRARLQVPVLSHLGAVVNFAAGSIRRAPPWMQRAGLEWLWRIKEEPALWVRYLRDGTALLYLLLTRVIPGALRQRMHTPDWVAVADARISLSGDKHRHTLQLHGAWCAANLARLRHHFDKMSKLPVAIDIDLSDVSYIDSAFVGLLMLMYGHQARHRLDFSIHSPSPRLRRMFRNYCAEFLLQTDDAVDTATGNASRWPRTAIPTS